ncbi:MAG: hypothetical protein Q4G26_13105 [Paracoccus sp. (in: a-proteobacteria)]|nr:hypothetical protein [Paracoccus sp. (in: a-proteobacteria)]
MIRLSGLAVLLVAFVLPGAAFADTVFRGPDGQEITLLPEVLAALPRHEVDTVHESSKGQQSGQYAGVLLWDLIAANTALDEDVKSALRHNVLGTARDDHQVSFSIGEIAPDFGNTPIMIGTELDGAPIPDGLRMVAPGDQRGARYVKDVALIEIR